MAAALRSFYGAPAVEIRTTPRLSWLPTALINTKFRSLAFWALCSFLQRPARIRRHWFPPTALCRGSAVSPWPQRSERSLPRVTTSGLFTMRIREEFDLVASSVRFRGPGVKPSRTPESRSLSVAVRSGRAASRRSSIKDKLASSLALAVRNRDDDRITEFVLD